MASELMDNALCHVRIKFDCIADVTHKTATVCYAVIQEHNHVYDNIHLQWDQKGFLNWVQWVFFNTKLLKLESTKYNDNIDNYAMITS